MLAATVMGWNGTQQRGLRTVSYRLLGVSLNVWFTKRFNILHQEKKTFSCLHFFSLWQPSDRTQHQLHETVLLAIYRTFTPKKSLFRDRTPSPNFKILLRRFAIIIRKAAKIIKARRMCGGKN